MQSVNKSGWMGSLLKEHELPLLSGTFNHIALGSGQIILFFFSKFPTFQHVAVTGTPNDAEHG